ncbi:MAG: peptidylprolyl isomerase [Syntrophaceae bacterium]
MSKAKNGDTVKVHYTGKLDDGTVFDSSENKEPLEFKIGEGQVIAGFEDAVIGMDKGDSKTARIPADKAYGPHREDMVIEVDRDKLSADTVPKKGELWQISRENDDPIIVMVADVDDSKVTLDANHPLAGKDLTFDIQVEEVNT